MEDPRDPFEPRHYLRLVGRWKWLLLAVVVTIPVAVYLVSKNVTKTYQAQTTLLVQGTTVTPGLTSTEIPVSTSSPYDVARLIQTPVVGDIAVKKLASASNGRALLGSVTATVDENATNSSGFVTITATGSDPEQTAATARAFAAAVATKRANDAATAIDDAIKSLSSEAAAQPAGLAKQNLIAQAQQLQAVRPSTANRTQVVDPAVTPDAPISPNPRRNAALGFILALLIAAGLLPLLDRLDRRIRDPDELEDLTGVPLLAMIPESAFPGNKPESRVREAFQTLRAGLTSFNVDQSLSSLLVTSPAHGDGKTTVAVHLAVALAQDERDVILVDGDLRRCQMASRVGIEPGLGLDAVLLERRSVSEALVDVPGIQGGRLRALPAVSHPPNPSVLLGSERMKMILAELTELTDIVVIDTPPLLVVSDAIPLIDQVSGNVLVARIGYTARDALRKTREVIENARGTILGVAATGTKSGGLYGYDEYEYGGGAEETGGAIPLSGQDGSGNGQGALRRLTRR